MCDFTSLKYTQWVVDHHSVNPGSCRLYARIGTDTIKFDHQNNQCKRLQGEIVTF